MNKLEQFKQLKDEIVQEILDNSDLSKYEKLQQISENNLWGYKPYIQHIFSEQEKEFTETVKASTGNSWATIDDFVCGMGHRDRRENIDMSDMINNLLTDARYDNTDIVAVLTNRSNKLVYEMKLDKVIDTIYDWCVTNQSIGFVFDW